MCIRDRYAADKLHGTGQVLARDLTEYKEELLKENIERVGFENIRTQIWDARIPDERLAESMDAVPVSYTHLDVYKRQP